MATLLFIAFMRRRWRRVRFKVPLTAKLLRPPGESLREEIQRLDEKLNENLIGFVIMCFVIGFTTWQSSLQQKSISWAMWAVILTIGYAICAIYGVRAFRALRLKHDYELGFLGERAVGEELNQMLVRGYEVFHDVPFEGRPGSKNFNIDHVAIGPGGVFVIETKTRRKQPKNGQDSPRNIVEFDGTRLIFPWGGDDFGIKQARANAGTLSAWLQKAVGFEIEAIPILALPGWSVERKGRGDVRVVSGREICSAFPGMNAKPALSVHQIKQIAFQLEQRCRNIEVD